MAVQRLWHASGHESREMGSKAPRKPTSMMADANSDCALSAPLHSNDGTGQHLSCCVRPPLRSHVSRADVFLPPLCLSHHAVRRMPGLCGQAARNSYEESWATAPKHGLHTPSKT
eukprot:2243769-Rhodomonas_salina.3